MTILIDRDQGLSSPALVPGDDIARDQDDAELTIGLINNMPDAALKELNGIGSLGGGH